MKTTAQTQNPQIKISLLVKVAMFFRKLTLALTNAILATGVTLFYVYDAIADRSWFAFAMALLFGFLAAIFYLTHFLMDLQRRYDALVKEHNELKESKKILMRIHQDL